MEVTAFAANRSNKEPFFFSNSTKKKLSSFLFKIQQFTFFNETGMDAKTKQKILTLSPFFLFVFFSFPSFFYSLFLLFFSFSFLCCFFFSFLYLFSLFCFSYFSFIFRHVFHFPFFFFSMVGVLYSPLSSALGTILH